MFNQKMFVCNCIFFKEQNKHLIRELKRHADSGIAIKEESIEEPITEMDEQSEKLEANSPPATPKRKKYRARRANKVSSKERLSGTKKKK